MSYSADNEREPSKAAQFLQLTTRVIELPVFSPNSRYVDNSCFGVSMTTRDRRDACTRKPNERSKHGTVPPLRGAGAGPSRTPRRPGTRTRLSKKLPILVSFHKPIIMRAGQRRICSLPHIASG